MAGQGASGASLYRVDTPCAVTRQYIAPTAKLTGITGIFGTTTPLVGGYSESSWTLARLSRFDANVLAPNASWGAGGYTTGTPRSAVFDFVEGPSKDLLVTADGQGFAIQSISKDGLLLGSGQGVQYQGAVAGNMIADGEFTPISLLGGDLPSFSIHLSSGTKTNRLPVGGTFALSGGRSAIGVSRGGGGVLAFGDGNGSNDSRAGVVTLVRFSRTGDLVQGFGTNGFSIVRRVVGPLAVTTVGRVLEFGDKVYVLASISSQTNESFLARVWM